MLCVLSIPKIVRNFTAFNTLKNILNIKKIMTFFLKISLLFTDEYKNYLD